MVVTIKLTDLENGKVGVDVESSEPFTEDNMTKACRVAGRMLESVRPKGDDNA